MAFSSVTGVPVLQILRLRSPRRPPLSDDKFGVSAGNAGYERVVANPEVAGRIDMCSESRFAEYCSSPAHNKKSCNQFTDGESLHDRTLAVFFRTLRTA